jgi:nicotinamide riboside kinase
MWRFYFKDRVQLINDDKPLVFVKSGMLFVTGSPFSGKDSLSRNITRRIRMIAFLEKERAPFIEHLDSKTKVELIFRNTINIGHAETIDNIVSIITKIVDEVDIIRFYATKNYDSVEYLEKYLKGEFEDETVS